MLIHGLKHPVKTGRPHLCCIQRTENGGCKDNKSIHSAVPAEKEVLREGIFQKFKACVFKFRLLILSCGPHGEFCCFGTEIPPHGV
jgi:hypothetical protein